MSRTVSVAATQFSCTWDVEANLVKAESLVREAACAGAQIILLQELFQTPYFCQDEDVKYCEHAMEFSASTPLLRRFSALAKELQVVLPVSYYERAGQANFNSIAVIDADGSLLGQYRKSHIPGSPGYEEKYYFSPGDTGFKIFATRYARIAPLICWDQWFPEAARCCALQGAEIILYPTAIGSEPLAPDYSSYLHWTRVMCGHAGANMIPVVVSNRIGTEGMESGEITFYGGSFIADGTGAIVAQVGVASDQAPANGAAHPAPACDQGIALASFDLDECAIMRKNWGIFRDRRPDLYGAIATLDGRHRQC